MPGLPVIANTFRCAFEWSGGGGATAVNVMHIQSATAMTATDAWNEINSNWDADQIGLTGSTCAIDTVRITPLDGTSPTQDFPTGSGATWQGQAGTDFIPQSAYIIKMTTNTRGKSYNGRLFLPFVGEAKQSSGSLDITFRNAVTAAWVAFSNALVADNWAIVIASYKLAVATQVTNVSCEANAATQRMRMTRIR